MANKKTPMLAAAVKDVEKLRFPLIASPKLDGIRCWKPGGQLLTRTNKPTPNRYVNEVLNPLVPSGVDGELLLRNPTAPFNEVSSAIMSRDGEPDFRFHAFDIAFGVQGATVDWCGAECYSYRAESLQMWREDVLGPCKYVKLVPTKLIKTLAQLEAYEARILAKGYEGVILRDPNGVYKFGRSTFNEHGLLKLKRFEDSEGRIVGFEEQMQNTNAKKSDGKRSSHKAGKVPKGTLGKFIVEDIHGLFPGVEIRLGGGKGITAALRQDIWDNQKKYLGRIVRYQYQAIGTKDAPRIATAQGFRDERDM